MENGNGNTSNTSIKPEDVITQLRALRAQIPDYTQQPDYSVAVLRNAASLDANFVDAATSAIGASAPLQQALGTTAEGAVAESSEASRWAQVEDELVALVKGVRNANLVRKHRIGVRALQAYSMTKQLVRVTENADLQPHLAEMRKHNRFGKGRRKTAPVPAPQGLLNIEPNDVQ